MKKLYQEYADRIFDKRFNSPYPIRRYYHRSQYQSILKYIKPGQKVLDAGCGEGVLSIMMAQKGAKVIGCDISRPNIETAKEKAIEIGGLNNLQFIEGDAENIPFEDDSFDLVVSSHVLEHLPDFSKGISEIYRVTKKDALIAVPTCLGLCGFSILGGADFWRISKESIYAIPLGVFKVVSNIFNDGVNEDYVGHEEFPHLRRFPWVVKRKIKDQGFRIVKSEAPSLCLPYFNFLLPVSKILDKFKSWPVFRSCGHGIIILAKKDR